ncbi:MAG: hypothetical protein ABIP55_00425 [Tepidisphaeraceae bacterium]
MEMIVKLSLYAAVSAVALAALPAPGIAQHAGHKDMPTPKLAEPAPTPGKQPSAPVDHSQMDQASTVQPSVAGGEHSVHAAMKAALGPYPTARESSGTAWQPDTSEHVGVMRQSGD